jgi:hypothetical protein
MNSRQDNRLSDGYESEYCGAVSLQSIIRVLPVTSKASVGSMVSQLSLDDVKPSQSTA